MRNADLYDLIRNETFAFNFYEKVIIKITNLLFKTKKSQVYFLKKFKSKTYKDYSVADIENIKRML